MEEEVGLLASAAASGAGPEDLIFLGFGGGDGEIGSSVGRDLRFCFTGACGMIGIAAVDDGGGVDGEIGEAGFGSLIIAT